MKLVTLFRALLLALLLAFIGRFSYLEIQKIQNERLTSQLCDLVGNNLETSYLRDAYEGLHKGLIRIGDTSACVSVTDNGRSFAPNCLETNTKYQATLCKAEGNTGIRAQIFYPEEALFNEGFIFAWIVISLLLVGIGAGLQILLSTLLQRTTQEVHQRLFEQSPGIKRQAFTDLIHWLLEKTGITAGVTAQVEKFGTELKNFELKIREDAAVSARREAEAKQSERYIEKVQTFRHNMRSTLSSIAAVQGSLPNDDLIRNSLATSVKKIEAMLEEIQEVDQIEKAPSLAVVELIIEESISILRSKFFKAKEVDIFFDYNSEQLSPVMIVLGEFRGILDNLLENAFDASSTGGEIRVAVSVTATACEISISDTGCGVSQEVLPKLFEKKATHGKLNGTGIGLYHAKQKIEAWKGKIQYEPLARGSRFAISLPLVQMGIIYVGLAKFDQLMVIDDDPTVPTALRRLGFDVLKVATNFEDGKILLSEAKSDRVTVLVDQHLGNGNLGSDLIVQYGSGQRLVLCTNDFDSPGLIKKAHHLGVKVLPKPLCFLSYR